MVNNIELRKAQRVAYQLKQLQLCLMVRTKEQFWSVTGYICGFQACSHFLSVMMISFL